jgi:hypothetical protein
MDNLGFKLRDAAKIIIENGPQIDALHEELDAQFTNIFESHKIFKISGHSTYDDIQSEGSWVYTSIFFNFPLAKRKPGRAKTSHHLAVQITIHDEQDINFEGWEPSVFVSFGTGDKDEPFIKDSGLLSSFSNIDEIKKGGLKVINHKLLTWDVDGDTGWTFSVPLIKITPANIQEEIIEPATSLISEHNIDTIFPEGSLAFNFEISNGKLVMENK